MSTCKCTSETNACFHVFCKSTSGESPHCSVSPGGPARQKHLSRPPSGIPAPRKARSCQVVLLARDCFLFFWSTTARSRKFEAKTREIFSCSQRPAKLSGRGTDPGKCCGPMGFLLSKSLFSFCLLPFFFFFPFFFPLLFLFPSSFLSFLLSWSIPAVHFCC